MANRYWVGSSGDWSDDDNHWATSSGGSPGNGNLPTSSDDVFIDSNSGFGGGGTITLDSGGPIQSHDFTCSSGHTFTISGENNGLNCSGSLILESGLTYLITGGGGIALSSNSEETITIAGATLTGGYISIEGEGTWTLQDDLGITGLFYQQSGTFDANDHNVTANHFSFYADTGYTPTVIMGSGTWEITESELDGWYIEELNGEVVTITSETSTIKFTGSENSLYGGKTYYNLWIAADQVSVFGDNTFNNIKIDAGLLVLFEADKTQTITSFTAGNLITLNSTDAETPTQFTLSKSSGIVSCDYLDISNSNATGGATWYAGSHSVDTDNNDGWLFEDAPKYTMIDSYDESNSNYTETVGYYYLAVGQSFTGIGTKFTAAQFYLGKLGSPTGNIYAKIYAHSGTFGTSSVPTGAPLAVSDPFDITTLSSEYPTLSLETFNFSSGQQFILESGTHYVLSVEYDNGSEGNALIVGDDNSSPTHPGNFSANVSGSWGDDSDRDLCFKLYLDIVSPFPSHFRV